MQVDKHRHHITLEKKTLLDWRTLKWTLTGNYKGKDEHNWLILHVYHDVVKCMVLDLEN